MKLSHKKSGLAGMLLEEKWPIFCAAILNIFLLFIESSLFSAVTSALYKYLWHVPLHKRKSIYFYLF